MLTLPTFPLLPALPIISQSVPHEPVDWRGTFIQQYLRAHFIYHVYLL